MSGYNIKCDPWGLNDPWGLLGYSLSICWDSERETYPQLFKTYDEALACAERSMATWAYREICDGDADDFKGDTWDVAIQRYVDDLGSVEVSPVYAADADFIATEPGYFRR